VLGYILYPFSPLLEGNMDLRKRLLATTLAREIVTDQAAQISHANDPALESLVEGRWVTAAGARCFVAERRYTLEHRHGGSSLSDLLDLPVHHWAPFVWGADDQLLDPRRAVFLDIETTGLARGGGTYAFLVGIGFFEDESFLARQYFMPDYADEEALLDLLTADLAEHAGLITFNGRSFDWPILETRFILARRNPPCMGRPHLDLLLLARRLWQRMLPSCALSALETTVLDVQREGVDVPGYLIPQLYQDYVRLGRTLPMVGVFYHNAMDLLSMVSLASRAGQVIASLADGVHDPSCDYLALGSSYERASQFEEALRAYHMAERYGRSDQETDAALARSASLLKRLGRHTEAMDIWRSQLNGITVEPYIEMAKQCEHRLRDYGQAERLIHEALGWVQDPNVRMNRLERRRLVAELEHRLARVKRRLAAATEYTQDDVSESVPDDVDAPNAQSA
jgi:uncharacterized protein